jgi:hypothetical protein
VSLGRNIF